MQILGQDSAQINIYVPIDIVFKPPDARLQVIKRLS